MKPDSNPPVWRPRTRGPVFVKAPDHTRANHRPIAHQLPLCNNAIITSNDVLTLLYGNAKHDVHISVVYICLSMGLFVRL